MKTRIETEKDLIHAYEKAYSFLEKNQLNKAHTLFKQIKERLEKSPEGSFGYNGEDIRVSCKFYIEAINRCRVPWWQFWRSNRVFNMRRGLYVLE